jgi:formate dehydrogenase iron-sulfur subunit
MVAQQQRLTFARVGVIDPVSVDDYVAHGGYAGLQRALGLTAAEIVHEVLESGLRGRGGAAFPTGIKWRTVLEQHSPQKYVVCNADEGDSGTFSDRMLMEGDPLCLVEGMTIAGVAVGATRGYIYLRCEVSARGPRTARGHRRGAGRAATSAPTSAAAARHSNSRSAWARAPTSVARKRRCSKASKASGPRCATAHPCRRSRACSATHGHQQRHLARLGADHSRARRRVLP